MSYSKKDEGAYCLFCALFGCGVVQFQRSKTEKLFFKPFQDWTNALKVFDNHGKSQFHMSCASVTSALLSRCKTKSVGIGTHLKRTNLVLIEENKKKLRPIIKTVIFCAQQGLAF